MEQILLGMVGMALMLAAFAAGVRIGRSVRGSHSLSQAAPDSSLGEGALNGAKTEAEAVQAAFEDLLAYSAETAYGMNRGVRGDD